MDNFSVGHTSVLGEDHVCVGELNHDNNLLVACFLVI